MHVASFSSQKAQWGKTILKQQKQKQIELSHYSQDPLGPGQQQRPLRTMQVVASGPIFLPCWHMFGVLKTMIQHDVVTDWYYMPFDVM